MTIIEILQAAGLDEATITKITEAMQTNKVYTTSEENMDIRYPKLKTQHEGVTRQLEEANALIEQLKKSTKGQEDNQQKIAAYEQQVTKLQAELEQTKLNAAIKVELLSSGAKDVDYLTFKLNEKLKKDGETLTLDDSGAVKGWDDKLNGLKTQFPTMFETDDGDGDEYQVLEPNKLQKGNGGDLTPTREDFMAMDYEQRVALKKKNEKLYKQYAK